MTAATVYGMMESFSNLERAIAEIVKAGFSFSEHSLWQ
jgi:hypothetical protein